MKTKTSSKKPATKEIDKFRPHCESCGSPRIVFDYDDEIRGWPIREAGVLKGVGFFLSEQMARNSTEGDPAELAMLSTTAADVFAMLKVRS